MPLCPNCFSPFHSGVGKCCPICGYSLRHAKKMFGSGHVPFNRVTDVSGVLTHEECQKLTRKLERWERRLSPVALTVYLTDRGKSDELCPHAHWILNQALLNSLSFGPREKMRNLENAELKIRSAEEKARAREQREAAAQHWPKRLLRCLLTPLSKVQQLLYPIPPAVEPQWVLMLVVDVQLKMACFSWGYMLDDYVPVTRLNRCIIKAKRHFKEERMLKAIEKVMAGAVSTLAAHAGKVHSSQRQQLRLESKAALALAALLALPSPAQEQWLPPSREGCAANMQQFPTWSQLDAPQLREGNFWAQSTLLRPHIPEPTTQERPEQEPSADTPVPPSPRPAYPHIINQDGLLDELECEQIERKLQELNARLQLDVFVCITPASQRLSHKQSSDLLYAHLGHQRRVLLLHSRGGQGLSLTLHGLNLSEKQRGECDVALLRARLSASTQANQILEAVAALQKTLAPHAEEIMLLSTQKNVPQIELPQAQKKGAAQKNGLKEKLQAMLQLTWVVYSLWTLASFATCVTLFFLGRFLWLRSARLQASEPDVRLEAPYGSGVSQRVLYSKGVEIKVQLDPLR